MLVHWPVLVLSLEQMYICVSGTHSVRVYHDIVMGKYVHWQCNLIKCCMIECFVFFVLVVVLVVVYSLPELNGLRFCGRQYVLVCLQLRGMFL